MSERHGETKDDLEASQRPTLDREILKLVILFQGRGGLLGVFERRGGG